MVRIFHIADIHAGREFRGFGPFAKTLRKQILATFRKTIETARAAGADAVVVAGDLFDKAQPDRADREAVWAAIGDGGLPVVVLPGTHDLLKPTSPYLADTTHPKNLLVVKNAPVILPGVGLAIHGRAQAQFDGQALGNIRALSEIPVNIATAHASIPRADIAAAEAEVLVTQAQIEATGARYCALGHWHTCYEAFPGSPVPTWYSGSPEPVQFDGDSGYALEVEIAPQQTTITRRLVGRYRWSTHEIDVRTMTNTEEVRAAIRVLAGPDRIVWVRFRGPIAPTAAFDADQMEDALAEGFAYLRLDPAGVQMQAEGLNPDRLFTPGTVGNAFVTLAKTQRDAAAEADHPFWDAVIRRGTAVLSGGESV
jgi:DNA repair exonuclease SbcCD nuclease subunit